MNIYRTNQISDRLIIISEHLGEWADNVFALVIGSEAAALVDTGMGVTGDLDRFISTLTDKPLRYCLLTHGDPDHVGSAPLFEHVFMSKADDAVLPWGMCAETRLNYVDFMSEGNRELVDYSAMHQVKQETFVYRDIQDGQLFDLGDVCLEAISFPGHSMGSMCFYNRKENYVLTGDAFNPYVWLWLDRCPSIEAYYENALAFLRRIGSDTTLYCGHLMQALPEAFPDEILKALREILNGKTECDADMDYYLPDLAPQAVNAKVHQTGDTFVYYRATNIRK